MGNFKPASKKDQEIFKELKKIQESKKKYKKKSLLDIHSEEEKSDDSGDFDNLFCDK